MLLSVAEINRLALRRHTRRVRMKCSFPRCRQSEAPVRPSIFLSSPTVQEQWNIHGTSIVPAVCGEHGALTASGIDSLSSLDEGCDPLGTLGLSWHYE